MNFRNKYRSKQIFLLMFIIAFICLLLGLSLFIGATDITFHTLLVDKQAREVFIISRLPRTFALVLVGCSMGVAGLIMQLVTQNKFVEPTTSGTIQSAALGLLIITICFPAAPLSLKMLTASASALLGTGVFLLVLKHINYKGIVVVPLFGMMFGLVIKSVTIFFALKFDLLQSTLSWEDGDFSSVIQGRYELLWFVALMTLMAYLYADQFTLAGLGKNLSTNVGLNYQQVVMLGLIIVSAISGIIVVVVGILPFLGLIVPNIISLIKGDNVRKNLPWVCLLGGTVVLLCDIIGRIIYMPFEVPVGTILGVVGTVTFIYLLFKNNRLYGY